MASSAEAAVSENQALFVSTPALNGGFNFRNRYETKELALRKTESYEVEAVQFTILSAEEMLKYSETKICNKELYYPMTQQPMPFGVLDARLGANKANGLCKTCGRVFQDCCGHWGYVTLYHPVFHIGYFKHLVNLLYCICKKCARLLMSDEDKKVFLARSRRCHDPILRRMLLKQLVAKCKRESVCLHPECEAPQGVLRRVTKPSLDQFMKIVLQKKVRREGPGSVASRTNIVNEDLDARYIRQLLKRVSSIDCVVLDVHMPEKFLISSLLVPPKCIRPSVTLGDAGTNEDDLTIVFSEIVDMNNILTAQSESGLQSSSVLGNWEFLQLQCARFINSEAPSVQPLLASKNISSPGRGICQRLKGKEGRFRGNLSGKRVDFSGRTVISPDANCPISDVVIPMWSAKRLTFPERVCESTIEKLRAAVLSGADEWPGAAFVIKKDGGKTSLRFANKRHVAENLQYGDIVERHLWDGDIVLFNRQPSLHRVSIMAHRARVMPWRTFRFNECVCTPYNADFDGDEMNCHLPQTQEARAEAFYLMGVVRNLVTPKNGEPLVAATQDFLSGTYMLTSKDMFLTRERFCLLCCYFTDGSMHIDLPPPTILKPVELWTGKQIINVLLRPNRHSENVMVNFELREREFSRPPGSEPEFMCSRDGYVIFQNSELICGALAKMTLGNGSKKGIFYNLIRDNSSHVAAACMGRIAKLAGRWFGNRGMTIGIDDVTPSPEVSKAKAALLEKGYCHVDEEIARYKKGQMQPNPGCTLEETLEIRVKSILDELRTLAGKMAQEKLPCTNKPLIMFLSGAKGALINIAQMIALVGQQNVGGQRIQNGFVDRTLPHFQHKSRDAKARGFVAHSFYDGLEPDEFFFHTMSGREGLVDTAVKTAETGYMQRRLVKALEDLSVRYDRTVRTSDGQIVQFVYGDDGLNPTLMEDKAKPISLDKVYRHAAGMVSILKYPQLVALSRSMAELSLERVPNDNDISGCNMECQHATAEVFPCASNQETGKSKFLIEQQQLGSKFNCSVNTDDLDLKYTVLPPDSNDTHTTNLLILLLRRHLFAAQRQLRQRHAQTRRLLSGLDPSPATESLNELLLSEKQINKKKRQRSKASCDMDVLSNTPSSDVPMKRQQLETQDTESSSAPKLDDPSISAQHVSHPIPRLLEEKLLVLESWRSSPRFKCSSENVTLSLLEKDEWYIQTKQNIIAHVSVYEWLPLKKQHVPLLPYEILQWAEYLMPRTAELLPKPLRDHQAVCMKEMLTHQNNTQHVRAFAQELRRWAEAKAHAVAQYRSENNLHPGYTFESYVKALKELANPPHYDQNWASSGQLRPCTSSNDAVTDSNESAVARHYRSAYPDDILLRRVWVVPDADLASCTPSLVKTEPLSPTCTPERKKLKVSIQQNPTNLINLSKRWKYSKHCWVTPRHLIEFYRLAWRKYNRALIEPGEAVGATGAQSIGEPGTQMTLKTFHFAGVASMNVTLGVPRIKEIINASSKIATPIIQVPLQNDSSFDYAVMVKSRIEKTLLGEVCATMKQVFSPEGAYLAIKLDKETISRNFLDITTESVRDNILATPGLLGSRVRLKDECVVVVDDRKLTVHPPVTESLFFDLQTLKQRIQNVCLAGLSEIKRGVIKQEQVKTQKESSGSSSRPVYSYSLAVEGYGLRDVMGTPGVVGTRCTSNHVMEVKEVLGIEAARFVIIDEIRNCMEAYSMDIDCRHMQLLGDVMTFRGDVLGISRFGIQKMRASTLMLASFEETNEHLFEAAAHHREDKIKGVSECIIMGKSMSLGTGAFDVLYNYNHQWTGAALDGGKAPPRIPSISGSQGYTSQRTALLLSKYCSQGNPTPTVSSASLTKVA